MRTRDVFRRLPVTVSAGFVLGLAATVVLANTDSASAAQAPVGLGTAASFGVLAGSTVTNTGPSVITGDVGVSPGTAITGFPPGGFSGVSHAADGVALSAQSDLTTAYNDAAGRTPVIPTATELAGRTLQPGVYRGDTLGLTGTVTLDAANNPDAVFVFQAASTLITGSASVVALLNGANPCNVYWQVGSSATLGTNSVFKGNLMALTSITATTGAIISGRLLARNGAVTLDDNVINRDGCTASVPTTTPATSSSAPGGGGTSTTPGGGGTSTTPGGGGTSTTPGGGGTSTTPGGGGTSTSPGGGTSTSPGGGTSTSPGGGPGIPLRTPGTSTSGGTTPPHTPSTGPSTTPFGPSTSPFGQPPHLSRTGSNVGGIAIWGAMSIVLGSIILVLARRRVGRPGRQH